MSEQIAIREAARRLGVSDTAVRKAITAGRIKVAGTHPGNGRPLLAWPQTQADWLGNSDNSKRTHVGSQGSPRRQKYAQPDAGGDGSDVLTKLEPQPHGGGLIRNQKQPEKPAEIDADGDVLIHDGMTLNEAKTSKEIYLARMAKQDYEERSGKLVEAEAVKASAFKVARTVRDGLLNLPDRVAHELAHETDAAAVHLRLTQEIRVVLEALAQPVAG